MEEGGGEANSINRTSGLIDVLSSATFCCFIANNNSPCSSGILLLEMGKRRPPPLISYMARENRAELIYLGDTTSYDFSDGKPFAQETSSL